MRKRGLCCRPVSVRPSVSVTFRWLRYRQASISAGSPVIPGIRARRTWLSAEENNARTQTDNNFTIVLFSGVGTNFGVGIGEARRAQSGEEGGFLHGEGVSQPPPHQQGAWGALYAHPAGSGFFVFCAVRLPFSVSQYELHTVCMARY